jgi:putative peptidoglycan lipid II flippase
MMILVGVFGQASGVAFYPYLTKLAAEKAYGKMSELLNDMLNKIALYLLPLTGIMMALAPQIILILYEHGKFTQASTKETAPIMVMYLTGAFASSVSILAARPFYAMQKTLLPMLVSTSVSILSIPLYYIFSKQMGAKGLGLAASVAMTVQFLILYIIWGKKYGGFAAVGKEAAKLGKIIAISAVGAGICYFIQGFFENTVIGGGRRIQAIIVCAAASIPSLTIVFILYEILKIQKIRESIRGLLKRRR